MISENKSVPSEIQNKHMSLYRIFALSILYMLLLNGFPFPWVGGSVSRIGDPFNQSITDFVVNVILLTSVVS